MVIRDLADFSRTNIGIVFAAMFASACSVQDPLLPTRTEPFLHLVLAPDERLAPIENPPAEQYAILMTTGSPVLSPCRKAQRFEMRRTSDAALFGWRANGNCLSVMAGEHVDVFNHANYYLPASPGPDSAGSLELMPGTEYALRIETDGFVLNGRTMIPESFSIRLDGAGDARRVVWPRVRGAAGYFIRVNSGTRAVPPRLQTDTTFPLDLQHGTVKVTALDPNLFTYQLDKQQGRAGIDAGFGVFGAMKSASLSF